MIKKSQHEIVGFVLIVLIVSVVGVIFLSLAISKGKETTQQSIEISNLLQSAMYYTTNCEINYAVQYREMQDLIKECYKNPNQKCLPKTRCNPSTESKISFSVNGKQGFWEHQNPNGNANPPLFVLNVKEGEEITLGDVIGTIYYQPNGNAPVNCRVRQKSAVGGFYNDRKNLIKEYNLVDFENSIKVPLGATKFYVYIKEQDIYRYKYDDNTGKCSFNLITKNNNMEKCEETLDKEENVCQVLESDLRNIIENSLNVGEDSPNKAYRLNIDYSALDNQESEEPILALEKGIFKNCTSIVGGSHTIIVSSFSSGAINVELESCTG